MNITEIEKYPLGATNQKELFEQVTRIFALSGITINEQAIAYMRPLLDSSQTFAEHQTMLKALIAEYGHE